MKLLIPAIAALLFVGCEKKSDNKRVVGVVSENHYFNNMELSNHTIFSLTTERGKVVYLAVSGHRSEIQDGVKLEVVYNNKVVSRKVSFYDQKNSDGSTTVVKMEIEYLKVISYKILSQETSEHRQAVPFLFPFYFRYN